MKKFNLGFLLGVTTTLGALAGAVFTFKKNVVEAILEEHRRRALRKSRSAHQG